MRWWIKIVKVNQVVYPHTFEHQNHVTDVGSLNLWNCGLLELFLVRPECIEPKALSWGYSTSSSSPLICRGLTYRHNNQTIHSRTRVISSLFNKSAINYIKYVINSQWCLCNVSSQNYFSRPFRSRLEYLSLHITRKSRINGQDYQLFNLRTEAFNSIVNLLHRLLNFILTSKET